MSTAYHPQTDGQMEVINCCLETYLRCFIADQPKGWTCWIPWAEYWFNTSFHESTQTTHFEVVYDRKPPPIFRCILGEVRVEAVQRELLDPDEVLKQLKLHLQRAQELFRSRRMGISKAASSQAAICNVSHLSEASCALLRTVRNPGTYWGCSVSFKTPFRSSHPPCFPRVSAQKGSGKLPGES
jgi:hypothetical protein